MFVRKKKLINRMVAMRLCLDLCDASCTKDLYYRKGGIESLEGVAIAFGIDLDKEVQDVREKRNNRR